jgi:GTPase SAR1 family protein
MRNHYVILICGGPFVGKTTLLYRLIGLSFPIEYKKTNGINIVSFELVKNDSNDLLFLDLVDIDSTLVKHPDIGLMGSKFILLNIFRYICLRGPFRTYVNSCLIALNMKISFLLNSEYLLPIFT